MSTSATDTHQYVTCCKCQGTLEFKREFFLLLLLVFGAKSAFYVCYMKEMKRKEEKGREVKPKNSE